MADSILKNATETQLDLAVEENLFALCRAMSTFPGSSSEETENLSRHYERISFRMTDVRINRYF